MSNGHAQFPILTAGERIEVTRRVEFSVRRPKCQRHLRRHRYCLRHNDSVPELREHHMAARVQAALVLPSSEFRVLESRQLYPRRASLTSRNLHLAALRAAVCSVANHPSKSANNQQKP